MSELGKDKEGISSLGSSIPFMSMGSATNPIPRNSAQTPFKNLFTPQSVSPIGKSPSNDNFTSSPSPGVFFPVNSTTPKKEPGISMFSDSVKTKDQGKEIQSNSLRPNDNLKPSSAIKSPGSSNPHASPFSFSSFLSESSFLNSSSKGLTNLESSSKSPFSISDQSRPNLKFQQERKDEPQTQSMFSGNLVESFKKKSDIISRLKEEEEAVKAAIFTMKNQETNFKNMVEEKKILIAQQKSSMDAKTKQIDEMKKQIQTISVQIEGITKQNSELKAKSDNIIIEYGPFNPQFIDYSKVPQSLLRELKKTEIKLYDQRKALKEKEKELFSNLNAKYNHYCNKIEKIRTNLAIHEKSLAKHNKFYGFHRLCENAFEELELPVLNEDENSETDTETETKNQTLQINEAFYKSPVFELFTVRNLGVFLFGIILSFLALCF